MAKRKCVVCGEWIESDSQSIPYKGRWSHEKCFQLVLKITKKDKDEKLAERSKPKRKQAKPPAELKDAVSEEDYAEKKQYYQYLRTLIDDELSAKSYGVGSDCIGGSGIELNPLPPVEPLAFLDSKNCTLLATTSVTYTFLPSLLS